MTALIADFPRCSTFRCFLLFAMCCCGTRPPDALRMCCGMMPCMRIRKCWSRFLRIMMWRDFPGGWIGDANNAFTESGRTRAQQEIFSYVQSLLRLRREHAALRGGWLWHLASDESSYVFARESEEERLVVAFNNADQRRELRVPLDDTPAQRASAIDLLLGDAKAELAGKEIHITMPGQSLSIFSLN